MKEQKHHSEKPQKSKPVIFVDPVSLTRPPHVKKVKYRTVVRHDTVANEQTIEKYYIAKGCAFRYDVVRSLPDGKRKRSQWWNITPVVNDRVEKTEEKDEKRD